MLHILIFLSLLGSAPQCLFAGESDEDQSAETNSQQAPEPNCVAKFCSSIPVESKVLGVAGALGGGGYLAYLSGEYFYVCTYGGSEYHFIGAVSACPFSGGVLGFAGGGIGGGLGAVLAGLPFFAVRYGLTKAVGCIRERYNRDSENNSSTPNNDTNSNNPVGHEHQTVQITGLSSETSQNPQSQNPPLNQGHRQHMFMN